ncbi:S8 family serine peptidase [Haloimpatiens sp. FM7330]|uniref:S8 family serine peptidase n=1 Tax=Haloimpatiens sp. FM7330 TaxID=3298610 RepID=UPI00362E44B5
MQRKHGKTLSVLLSALLAVSTVAAAPLSVSAKTETNTEKEQIIKQLQEAYKKTLTKLGDYKGKYNFKNDNAPKKEKVNPQEKVRVIIQVEGKTLKDQVAKGKKIEMNSKNQALLNSIKKAQQPLKKKVTNINRNIKIKKTYGVLINGFSAEVQYKDIEKIKEIPGVKHVSVAKVYYPEMNTAKGITNAEKVWKDYGLKGEGLVVSIIDTGIDVGHKDMRLSDSSKAKIKKADIDANQDDRGNWYTEKVPYGYNFADDNHVVKDTTDSMHGMHVAGIVGANCENEDQIKDNTGIRGVAPEAQLLAMKVFSNDPKGGGAFQDDIVAAIEDSVTHKADVINMSLGSTAAFQDAQDPEQKAIEYAVDHGVSVVVSAGNSTFSTSPYKIPGVNDTGLVGSPGLAEDSLQVASYENTTAVYKALTLGETKIPYSTSEMSPIGVLSGKYQLVDCGKGKPEDFQGKDLTNKIALIERGGLTFVDKKLNAQAAGAVGAIVYNNAGGGENFINMATDPGVKIPGIFVRRSDGLDLQKVAGKEDKISFPDIVTAAENINANDMSDFTSWGPTPNLDFKPEISAPGGQIWSTVNDNKYENMSGTSMASPHMAGSMALIMQHVKQIEASKKISFASEREKVEFGKKLAVNTAKVQMDKAHPELPYSPRRQGAGLVDTKAAVENNVTVEYKANGKPVVALKEVGNQKEFTLKLHNYGDNAVTYTVAPQDSKVLTETMGFVQGMSFEQEMTDSHVGVNKSTITVEPGKDAEVDVMLTMGGEKFKNSFAEGFIKFTPENKGEEASKAPELGIPYMGFYGDWNGLPTIGAPMWEDSFFGTTTLLTKGSDGDYYYLGQTGSDGRGNPIVKEDKIAISTNKGALTNNSVVPILFAIRNAKTLKVQVLDNTGKVVRNVSLDNNIRKIVISDPHEAGYRLKPNWLWDGTLYNSKTGKYEKAEDGQYTIRVASCIDYKGAKPQNLDMKVKVDSIAPEVEIVSNGDEVKPDNTYSVKFKAKDDKEAVNSGIKQFVALVDGDLYKENGKVVFFNDIKPNKDGIYNIDLKLPEGKHDLAIGALDYAGNLGLDVNKAYKKGFNASISKKGNEVNPENLVDGNFEVNYYINDNYINAIDQVNIYLDGKKVTSIPVEKDKPSYVYSFKDVAAGKHKVTLKGIKVEGENEKNVYEESLDIQVQDNKIGLEFDNIQSGMQTNEENYVVTGSLKGMPDKFTINDEDVKVENLKFTHTVKLKAGTLNKVKVFIKKGEEEFNYSYNVYCDTKAPEIAINAKGAIENNNEVVINVPKDTEKYTLKGTVKDDAYGYTFYINGNADHHVSFEMPNPEGSVYDFEKEVELTAKTTIVNLKAVDEMGNEITKIVKIVKENSTVVGDKLTLERINFKDTYKNGEQFRGGVKVINNSEEAKSATLIVGVFDKNNKMVNVNLATQVVGAKGSVELSSVLSIPQQGEYSLRCFVWDSLDTMLPLSEIIQIPVLPNENKVVEDTENNKDKTVVEDPEENENKEEVKDEEKVKEEPKKEDPKNEEEIKNEEEPKNEGNEGNVEENKENKNDPKVENPEKPEQPQPEKPQDPKPEVGGQN